MQKVHNLGPRKVFIMLVWEEDRKIDDLEIFSHATTNKNIQSKSLDSLLLDWILSDLQDWHITCIIAVTYFLGSAWWSSFHEVNEINMLFCFSGSWTFLFNMKKYFISIFGPCCGQRLDNKQLSSCYCIRSIQFKAKYISKVKDRGYSDDMR